MNEWFYQQMGAVLGPFSGAQLREKAASGSIQPDTGLLTYLPCVAIAVYTGSMNPQIIRDMLNRRPFEPFVLRLSSGDAYEIRHPEMALLLKNGVYIALPANDGDFPDRAVYCPFLHVAAAETLAVR